MKITFILILAIVLNLNCFAGPVNQDIDISPSPIGASVHFFGNSFPMGIGADILVFPRLMIEVGTSLGVQPAYSLGGKLFLTNPKKRTFNWNLGFNYISYLKSSSFSYFSFGFTHFALSNFQLSLDIGPAIWKEYDEGGYYYDGSSYPASTYTSTVFYGGLKLGYRFGSSKTAALRKQYKSQKEANIISESDFYEMQSASNINPLDTTRETPMLSSKEQNAFVLEKVNAKYGAKKVRKVSVEFMDGTVLKKGVILSLTDKDMEIAYKPTKAMLRSGHYTSVVYPVSDINKVLINKTRAGATIGAVVVGVGLAGISFVVLFGVASVSSDSEVIGIIIGGALLGASSGGLLGAAIGSAIVKEVKINGDQQTYQTQRLKLEKYSIEKYKIK